MKKASDCPATHEWSLTVERRLARVEILAWLAAASGVLGAVGFHIFDAITIWGHP